MRFLKQKTLSQYSANDDALMVYDSRSPGNTQNGGRAVMDLTGGFRLPKGTTSQRPKLTNVRTPNGPNGYIRYNTTTNSLEAYIDGNWEVVKAPGATAIQRDDFTANGTQTVFGPLDTDYVSSYSVNDNNIMVLLDNVWQVGDGENFSVEQSSSGSLTGPTQPYADGWYVKFTSAPPALTDLGDPLKVRVYYGFAN